MAREVAAEILPFQQKNDWYGALKVRIDRTETPSTRLRGEYIPFFYLFYVRFIVDRYYFIVGVFPF